MQKTVNGKVNATGTLDTDTSLALDDVCAELDRPVSYVVTKFIVAGLMAEQANKRRNITRWRKNRLRRLRQAEKTDRRVARIAQLEKTISHLSL